MLRLIDTHCHLDFAAFNADRDRVLEECIYNGVVDIVVPAVTQASWQQTIDLCCYDSKAKNGQPNLYLALGLHPIFIEQHQPQHLLELDQLVTKLKPKAIGEIGLDFYLRELDQDKQQAFFDKQLIIAKQHRLPAIIHVRKAHDQCVLALNDVKLRGGIIHNFNGSIQHAFKYIDLGFKLGFGGMVTFDRSSKLKKLVEQIPLDSIVLETDAPDLSPERHRGERNSPEYLPLVLDAVAKIKQLPREVVAETTTANARDVLNLPS